MLLGIHYGDHGGTRLAFDDPVAVFPFRVLRGNFVSVWHRLDDLTM